MQDIIKINNNKIYVYGEELPFTINEDHLTFIMESNRIFCTYTGKLKTKIYNSQENYTVYESLDCDDLFSKYSHIFLVEPERIDVDTYQTMYYIHGIEVKELRESTLKYCTLKINEDTELGQMLLLVLRQELKLKLMRDKLKDIDKDFK